MLRNINDLDGYAIHATDGNIGHVKDFYFDDKVWVIRYLVVETGSWLSSRKVLISPIAVDHPNWQEHVLPVSITKEQVKNSPEVDTDKPVSRQHEIEFLGYYNYPYYWGGAGLWGGEIYPSMMTTGSGGFVTTPDILLPRTDEVADAGTDVAEHPERSSDLRSCKEVMGYQIEATDGDIGHVVGLLIEEDTWAIRYLIVDIGNLWSDRKILIAPHWIDKASWLDTTFSINLTRQAVKDAPHFDPATPLDRKQEVAIYEHYGRSGYWAVEAEREEVLSPD